MHMDGLRSVSTVLFTCSLLQLGTTARTRILVTGDVRLAGGESRCEGRLEVYQADVFINGWFSACERNVGAKELRVVCRQLGCLESPSRQSILSYGSKPNNMMAFRRNCTGSEQSTSECPEVDSFTCDFYNSSDFIAVTCNHAASLMFSSMMLLGFTLLALFFTTLT